MKRGTFNELKRVFEILQGPGGCLWDKKQTHRSLIPYLREESQEFIAAVKKGSIAGMKEELGDILLQVMFHAQIAKRTGTFTIEDVIEVLIGKLKRRHPHVFGTMRVTSSEQIIRNWHAIKAQEKRRQGYGKR